MNNLNSSDVVQFDKLWYVNANADEQKMFREWLLSLLKVQESVEITFYKKDGTERTMSCTLKEGKVPNIENPKTSDTLCTVWDTVLNQWRSFHFDRIKNINFTI